MSERPLLEVEDVARRHGARRALDGLDFTLSRGEVLGLLGVNGAGKSTALRLIAGVLRPDRGRIRIDGRELADDPGAARRLVGYLPERPPLYPELSVREHLDFAARLRGLGRAEARSAQARALAACDLEEVVGRLAGALSKGFQQRLGLALAVLHDPPLLLLDEPTSGLDPLQAARLRALVRALRERHAVVLSTHQLAEVPDCCDRVAMLHEGRLRWNGTLAAAGGDAAGLERRFLAIALGSGAAA